MIHASVRAWPLDCALGGTPAWEGATGLMAFSVGGVCWLVTKVTSLPFEWYIARLLTLIGWEMARASRTSGHRPVRQDACLEPPATEYVTRLATNKRFANVQLTTNTTTVPRYLLSCWLKRDPHTYLLSYPVRNTMSPQGRPTLPKTQPQRFGRTVGPPARGTII